MVTKNHEGNEILRAVVTVELSIRMKQIQKYNGDLKDFYAFLIKPHT